MFNVVCWEVKAQEEGRWRKKKKTRNIIKALKSHIVTHFSIVHHFPSYTLYFCYFIICWSLSFHIIEILYCVTFSGIWCQNNKVSFVILYLRNFYQNIIILLTNKICWFTKTKISVLCVMCCGHLCLFVIFTRMSQGVSFVVEFDDNCINLSNF